jgi:hypothetical protein
VNRGVKLLLARGTSGERRGWQSKLSTSSTLSSTSSLWDGLSTSLWLSTGRWPICRAVGLNSVLRNEHSGIASGASNW